MKSSRPEVPEPDTPEPDAPEAGAPEAGAPEAGAAERGPAAGEPPAPRSSRPKDQAETYEEAAARIEQIIRRLDSGEASLNETLELVREGKGLIELCASELQAVAGALEELRLEELVERLEGQVPD
jgi:exodeoxyribonuclease VII small subunit